VAPLQPQVLIRTERIEVPVMREPPPPDLAPSAAIPRTFAVPKASRDELRPVAELKPVIIGRTE
jgi:hypothetical protein